ncbi:PepSY domain-containing protein [Rhodoferax sp.]|uniref:PepSY domain-containing protein n=1 Tax=Rhodoferax sp. TaxID=50421 RepID=UPI00284317DA|nr:PepSY domain-containing protein [Rhodoferax sp.]MDR3369769.1 PepSY domain-containing protein [Rhodoferax sp.]
MLRHTKIGLITITLAATGIAAYAAKTMESETAILPATKITLSQAVNTAEQHAGGHATRAELEQSKTGLTYHVEVINGASIFDVEVDPDKGTVLASTAGKGDHGDGQDGPDENDGQDGQD